MRVMGLAGSPRARGSTTKMLVEAGVRGAADSGADIGVIEMAHLRIGRCRGCGECFRTGRCPQEDDLQYLLDSMRAADGIILGCPSHTGGVTASIESAMERMRDMTHCRQLEGKYGCGISVSRMGDEGFAVSRMNRFLCECGIAITGGLGVPANGKMSMDEAVAGAEALGHDLVAAIREKRRYPEQERSRAEFLGEFKENIVANKEKWPHDYRYWLEKGWL